MNFKKIIQFKFLYLVVLMIGSIIFSELTFAENEEPLGFTVESILPDSQIDKEQGYFYLKTEPNKNQEVKVKVKGTSDDPVKIKVYTANASTSEQGTVEYKVDSKNDETLKDSIKDITQVDTPEFEIKKNEEKIVTVKINVPKDHYEGVKLGTIYFQKVDDKNNQEGTVNSTYAYRIGLLLSENELSYKDGKSLNLISVSPELKRLQKTIQLKFQNPEPKLIEDFTMDVSIIDQKNGKVIKRQKLTDGRLAPNSSFDFGLNWGIQPIPAGKYIAKADARSSHEVWHLEKEFTITGEQAKKMNEETVYKLTLPFWAYIVTILLAIAIFADTFYMMSRRKKLQKSRGGKKRKTK